jgi:hypothetical protein
MKNDFFQRFGNLPPYCCQNRAEAQPLSFLFSPVLQLKTNSESDTKVIKRISTGEPHRDDPTGERGIRIKGLILNESNETGWKGLGISGVCPLAESASEDPA